MRFYDFCQTELLSAFNQYFSKLMRPVTISLLRFPTVFKSYQIPPHYVTNAKRGL